VSKIVNLIDHKFAKNKAILYFLPVGILFVNGEVLGLLAVLFVDNIRGYLYGIFPHGFFEIPAIILSGSIGLEISEECQKANETFQEYLTMLVRSKFSKFTLVILLIILGGFLEGGAL
jgi:stage II sporulation protein M